MSFDGIAPKSVEGIVTNDGFFPDLDLKRFIDGYSVSSEYSTDVVTDKLLQAVIYVNRQIRSLMPDSWENSTVLEEVNDADIDGRPELVVWYEQAVFSLAKSKLLVSVQHTTQRDTSAAQAIHQADNKLFWMNESDCAIRNMTGDVTSAELI